MTEKEPAETSKHCTTQTSNCGIGGIDLDVGVEVGIDVPRVHLQL